MKKSKSRRQYCDNEKIDIAAMKNRYRGDEKIDIAATKKLISQRRKNRYRGDEKIAIAATKNRYRGEAIAPAS